MKPNLTERLKSRIKRDHEWLVATELKMQTDGQQYERDYVPDFADGAIAVQEDLSPIHAAMIECVEALRKTKAALWCENVDEENAAYEFAREALLKLEAAVGDI
jgi:hypothetical protein